VVDDGSVGGVPSDFLKGEGMAQEAFCEAFAAYGVMEEFGGKVSAGLGG
jgi:hypothetical protein